MRLSANSQTNNRGEGNLSGEDGKDPKREYTATKPSRVSLKWGHFVALLKIQPQFLFGLEDSVIFSESR